MPEEKTYPYVGFRAGEITDQLRSRTSPYTSLALVAKRDLDRYYRLLADELSRVELSEAEASLIVDTLNGTLMEPHTMRLLWAEIADAIRLNGLDRKWGLSKHAGEALIEKLKAASPAQSFAIVDAAERFWRRVTEGIDETNEERLRAVGLQPAKNEEMER